MRSDGTVWAWGQNRRGETGTGSPLGDDVSPAQVVGLTDAVAIAGGVENGYALTADGRAWSWGYDYWGQLGTGAPCADPAACHSGVPVLVAGLTDVVAIGSGSSTALALRADGSVWAWGLNNLAGNLGNGTSGSCTTTPRSEHCLTRAPVRTSISGVSAVSAGGVAMFAIKP
ncbi:RCC1 domain-containing protein [Saccharothrix texasensis]|uniref:RCC1 domain-containing protein n=1 Tax=Saccharothrix texasensis TaxID=103734 RepID=UPI003CCC8347